MLHLQREGMEGKGDLGGHPLSKDSGTYRR